MVHRICLARNLTEAIGVLEATIAGLACRKVCTRISGNGHLAVYLDSSPHVFMHSRTNVVFVVTMVNHVDASRSVTKGNCS